LSRVRWATIGVTLTPNASADGYVENFLADDANRDKQACPAGTVCGGRRSTGLITAIKLNVVRDPVKSSPACDPLTIEDQVGILTSVYPPFVYPRHLHR